MRKGGDVLNRADLEAGRLQRPDRGLPAGSRSLDEDVNLAHAVLHGTARRGLRGLLCGVRRRLARALKPDLAGGGPRDHGPGRIGDRDDGVVERGADVRVPVRNVLPFLAAHLLGCALLAALARRHLFPDSLGGDRSRKGLLLPGLLLAGDGLLLALAGTRVGLRPLTVYRQPPAVPDALVGADLDLAANVGRDFAAKVALNLVVRVDVLAELGQVILRESMNPGVTAHSSGGEGLRGPGAPDAVDIGKRDLKPLLTR